MANILAIRFEIISFDVSIQVEMILCVAAPNIILNAIEKTVPKSLISALIILCMSRAHPNTLQKSAIALALLSTPIVVAQAIDGLVSHIYTIITSTAISPGQMGPILPGSMPPGL